MTRIMNKFNLILMILLILLCLTNCTTTKNKKECDDFKYELINGTAYVYDLSESGKKKEAIMLPAQLDGYKTGLKELGIFFFQKTVNLQSDSMKNLYLNTDISKNLAKENIKINTVNCNIFIPFYTKNLIFQKNNNFYYSLESVVKSEFYSTIDKTKIANVSYNYNYNKIGSHTYFIDDVDGEKITNIPPTPYREGYIFEGWYKEKECINEWNFDVDIVPSKEYTEEGEYIYKEITLYAKWGKEDTRLFEYEIDKGIAYIGYLTEWGEQQKTIMYPATIDGYETKVKITHNTVSCGLMSNVATAVYLNSTTFQTAINGSFDEVEFRIFKDNYRNDIKTKVTVFVPFYREWFSINEKHQCYYSYEAMIENNLDMSNYNIANVSYYYNCHHFGPETFFIDDVDGEKIVNIPPAPYCEGYIFEGWYKEKECINEWNFDVDIIPSKEYTEEGEYIYKETILYAKWVEE